MSNVASGTSPRKIQAPGTVTGGMVCPYLSYRRSAGEQSFDTERAYCEAVESFVQPMRADICNDRYGLDHRFHCEIYREHADDAADVGADRAEGTDE